MVKDLWEVVTSKSALLRRRVAGYMHVVLELFHPQDLEGYLDIIEESISKLVCDADEEC